MVLRECPDLKDSTKVEVRRVRECTHPQFVQYLISEKSRPDTSGAKLQAASSANVADRTTITVNKRVIGVKFKPTA